MSLVQALSVISTSILAAVAGFASYMLVKVYKSVVAIEKEATRVAKELAKYKVDDLP